MEISKKLLNFTIFLFTLFMFNYAEASTSQIKGEIAKTIAKNKFHSNKERRDITNLWIKLSKDSHVVLIGKDSELRTRAVVLQSMIEASIVKGLENKYIISAVGVIHTSIPATPLRITESSIPPGIVPKEYVNNKTITDNIIFRHHYLVNFLKFQGTLIAVYSNKTPKTKTIGLVNFINLLAAYKNLIDKPLKNFQQEYSGATYLVKDKEGNIIAFSISAPQISNAASEVQEWELWFGSIKSKSVSKRIVMIDSFLKSNDVDMYQYLK